LRRIVISLTAVVVLGAAAAAIAAAPFNTYTATMSFSPGKAGSPSKPVGTSVTVVVTISGTNGNRAAPLTHTRSTIYGLKYDSAAVKAKCTLATVSAHSNDASCPKAALVATADIHALLGPAKDPSATSTHIVDCKPGLRVWNAGSGKLTFFLWSTTTPGSAHYCGGIPTGSTPPYSGTIKNSGKNLVIDEILPPYVSSKVLGGPTWGSLIGEKITWRKISNGKHSFVSSVGCKKGKRPWQRDFTADFTNPADTVNNNQSFTVTGSAKCS
jgi:hypothetical protein